MDSPQPPEAAFREALAHHRAGRFDEAEAAYRRALDQAPGFAAAHANLAELLKARGRPGDALACYRRALEADPGMATVWSNLARTLWSLGRPPASVAATLRVALRLDPARAGDYALLCLCLRLSGRAAEAVAAGRWALRIDPAAAGAHDAMAGVLYGMGATAAAMAHAHRALALFPAQPGFLVNVAAPAMDGGALSEAIRWYRRALSADTGHAMARLTLAHCLRETGDADEALAIYRDLLEREPGHVMAHQNLLMALLYSSRVTPAALLQAHRVFAARHAPPDRALPPPAVPRAPKRPLVVGYVSGDLRHHPVAAFLEPVLAAHDPDEVRVLCYSENPHDDAVTERLRRLAHGWRSTVGLDDDAAAAMVRADGVDVLVDLAGHTAFNRLLLFARRPAPVQVTWLGYPATTGLPAIDARLVDAVTDPPGADDAAVERLVRLERGFLCYGPPADAPAPGALPAGGGTVTFGSFNTLSKVHEGVIALWAAVLDRVEGSRLRLKSRGLADGVLRRRIADAFAAHGIGAERIDLLPWTETPEHHLAAYRHLDVALDPFPYNGTTTTCEALWMGVPVVTLAGDRHLGRVGASLLTQVGLPELVARDEADYVTIAAALAEDRARLSALRAGLRSRMAASPLCDAPGFTRRLEAVYRGLWKEWRTRATPAVRAPLA